MLVKNRVDAMKKISDSDCCHYSPKNENPADTLSRDENLTSQQIQELR